MDRVERREERGLVREERSSAKRVSRTVTGRERWKMLEEDSVRRTVRLRTRQRETSDYSSQSQSDSEPGMVTSTPKTGHRHPLLLQGSPRLRAFDGDGWVTSPRTTYTYTQSLTYRDRVTPGREVPMPHMTRLPLYSHQAGLEPTELWELSELELTRHRLDRLEEYSEDELSPLSPHLIYRRRLVKRSLTSSLYSLLCYLLLPLTYVMSVMRVVTSRLSIVQSEISGYFSLLINYLAASYRAIREPRSTQQPLTEPLQTEDDLLTEDEDESGLEQFLSNQKIQHSNIKTAGTMETNSTESSHVSKLLKVIRSLLFVDTISSKFWKLIPRSQTDPPKGNTRVPKRVIFTGVPEMPQTGAIDPYVSDEREFNVRVIQDDEELQLNLSNNPKPSQEGSVVSRTSKVSNVIISSLLYPFVLSHLFVLLHDGSLDLLHC